MEIQDGASNGYYRSAALDGSRPAIYFINMKDLGDWPKYTLPALTYHEGNPGHHLQISLAQQSTDIPTLRKLGGFSAYSEGWALYAEQVADELGAYQGIERAGYLQSFLFRAARLVVDTVFIRRAGAAKRQSITWSRRPALHAPGSSAKWNVTALRWGRPAVTRSGIRRGSGRERKPKSRSVRNSTSSNSTKCSRTVQCR